MSTPPSITVHVGGPSGRRTSPELWGLFLEDINDALDGGLNADLVRNGDFEATAADAPGWHALTGWDAEPARAVSVRSDAPLSSTNATFARMTAEGSPVSLRNGGYDPSGMLLRAGRYRLRLAARTVDRGSLDARLVATGGDGVLASAPLALSAPEAGWTWLEADLDVAEEGRAVLDLRLASGVVDVDLVELRPLGEDGSPLLFRPDLVQALAALRPAFVRFPGGCVAHGYGLDNIYHWKRTIGPREQRVPMPNTWGYHQSMRIGYHEYFLLCEQLGASPMPVVAAGVCCQNVPGGPQAIPVQRMPQYVQDVLDLVEYANGAPDTRWGAVRAAAGHPEPFGLRYLGIGNEDVVDAQFEDRFTRIYEAVRAAYPEVTVIGTLGPKPYGPDYDNGWELARRLDVPMVDEHSYRTPRWLLQNVERFEGYARTGPLVYLGEWAGRTSTVRSAVAEAAYMVGIERSSDVVRLASYAPLLARVGSTQWVPDLVYFTDEEVLPSASYHVQRMLAEHRGDEVLECVVEGAQPRPQPLPSMEVVELRSPGATTRFTGLRVDGVALGDVEVGPEDVETLAAGGSELEVRATRLSGEEGFVVGWGSPAAGTVHEVRVGEWRNKALTLSRRDDGVTDEIDGPHPYAGVRTGVEVHVRVRVDDARIRVWVDGTLVHDHLDDVRPWLDLVVGATRRGAETLLTVVSAADGERSVRVLTDACADGAQLTTTQLAGAGPDEGRPFERSPVSPRTWGSRLAPTPHLDLEVPPWSVTTVRLSPA
ncbi:MAG TPA: alpha-L-arabinofuranosidase C-terminal domain-containing protein [Actinotalea caeni]|uniref:alpha-L-arabinofuranosidase C-terminal domain-containing protein n=1 Tax=Actinotalea caeni TaxID=1348467 RepID=UPI002B4B5D70|nr:alpha-L-arabinofuranosidase C-terminal domain-containing protein [Actinotalea caeni]HLV53942.1 alpha-L-arabinofuranosidase C-terminal domain-containing protein [Actinotalea caeni]